MKVMIAAGGTGGHIYPALALADILKKTDETSEIVFFGSSNRMEANVIPDAGYRFYGVEMSGMNGGVLAKASSAASILKAEKYCKKILKKEKPDICIGFGNYISVPLIRMAHRMHIPCMLHEQNSYAGKANRFLAGIADAIVGCYEDNLQQFPVSKTRLLGNPEATIAYDVRADEEEIRKIGLDPNKPFVLFMMGSLGSSSVSEVIDQACTLFDPAYQYVIAAGKSNAYTFQTVSDDHIKIVPYVNGKVMLKGCALAVLRAGATTMAELGAIGTPSILIPSPYVPNNHQYHNAMALVSVNGAELLEEKDLSAESLAKMVNDLMHDQKKREDMRDQALKCGRKDAAYEMIEWMKELVKYD